jgi:pSer/pThr/pTyr-binding forkhead associated (FHA) protein
MVSTGSRVRIPLRASTAAVPHDLDSLPMPEIWLVVSEGPDAGREWRLSEALVIGRAGDADVVLADPTVSRHHASISAQGETAVVEDLESSNGTFVNGQQLAQPRRVGAGDVIGLGTSTAIEVTVGPTGSHTPTGEPTVVEQAPEPPPSGGTTAG